MVAIEHDELTDRRRGSLRNTLFIVAVLVITFFAIDWMTVGAFVPAAFAVRLGWAVVLASLGVSLRWYTTNAQAERLILVASGTAPLFFGVIVSLAGGAKSPLYVWQTVLPIVAVVLARDRLAAVVATSLTSLVACVGCAIWAGAPVLEWFLMAGMVAGSGALGALSSAIFLRERRAEQAAEVARNEALAQLAQSEHKRMEAERLATVGRLAAGVAHEINNPLAYMKANIGVLEQEFLGPPSLSRTELVELFADTQQGMRRIQQIVADLRSSARDASDAPAPAPAPTPALTLLREK